MLDNSIILHTLTTIECLETNGRQWWAEALLFDALIGNTDRHQDNWGFIFQTLDGILKCKLTPLFDNGTSLGHERFPEKVKEWQDSDIERYITNVNKACHHAKWTKIANEPVIKGHFELLEHVLQKWPETRDGLCFKLNFSKDEMSEAVNSLCQIESPVPFSQDRMAFVVRLLVHRYNRLKSLLS